MIEAELSLLRERTPEGVADHLAAFARARSGAVDAVLWLADPDGALRRVRGDGRPRSRRELGFEVLPAFGEAETAPPPWRGRHSYVALAVTSGDNLVGVLALAFEGVAPRAVVLDAEIDGRLTLAAAVLERHALRGRLADAQRDAIARVGAGLAHTLGNVLQAALSCVDHARAASAGENRASLAEASDALKRASAVTCQLAALGGTRGDPHPTELSALVSGLVAALEPQMPPGIALALDRASGELWSDVDPASLEAAIAGLVYTAREELGALGRIRLALRGTAPVPHERWVEVEVAQRAADDPAGERVTLPSPPSTVAVPTNDGGDTTGAGELGLTLARAAVAPYRGSVEHRAGRDGRTVVIRLPATTPRGARGGSVSTAKMRAVSAQLRVLVADDEPAVLRGVQRLLSAAGHEIRSARDGAEAVSVARGSTGLDVALVDLTMPNLGGPPLVAALRRVVPGLPVVVMTGYASDEMVAALRREGVAAVLKKPVSGVAMLEAITQAVEQNEPASVERQSTPG